jgi:hypothetical protein
MMREVVFPHGSLSPGQESASLANHLQIRISLTPSVIICCRVSEQATEDAYLQVFQSL